MTIKQTSNGTRHVNRQSVDTSRTRKNFTTKADAIRRERAYINENTPIPNTDNRRLSDLVQLWYELHGSTLSSPDKFHRVLLATTKALGNPIANQLTPEKVLRYRSKRLQSISKKTWNNELGQLKSVYNKLIKYRVINYPNPIASIDPLRLDEDQTSYLSEAEITRLLDEIQARGKNKDTWWVAQICLRTGARWREAEGLLRKQLRDGLITYTRTKTKKTRSVPVSKDFFDSLLLHIGHKGTNERIFGNCMKAFEHAVKRAAIVLPEGQCTHICRHTFASHFIMRGGDILVLQKILGHTDIKMTMRYTHLSPEYLAEAIQFSPLQ